MKGEAEEASEATTIGISRIEAALKDTEVKEIMEGMEATEETSHNLEEGSAVEIVPS